MSNDDRSSGTMLSLLVGGAAGYAAGRWIIEPWLAARAGRPGSATRRSLSAGPVPCVGPSGTMQPVDPYADPAPAVAPSVTAPTSAEPTKAPPVAGPIPPAPADGPITSPSQVVVPAPAGPITSPSQVGGTPQIEIAPPRVIDAEVVPPKAPVIAAPPSSSGRSAISARVRRFDPIFDRYRGTLPLAYLRALVDRESNGRPAVRTGSAVGLMQIVPVVLADYNKRHGTAYESGHLVDPAINVAIGCELLRLIVHSYAKHHPRVPNLQADWSNPRFVELLTFGWNAGFSEAGGVGRVVRYLEKLGAVDITLDQVTAHAKLAGASKHLSNPAKVAWCKSVVALYLRERALVEAPATLVVA